MGKETNIARGRGGRLQERKTRANSWTAAKHRQAFLENLAASCNVKRSCAEAGLAMPGGYRRRLIDPHFASQWDRALAEGHRRLHEMLCERAAEGLEKVEGSKIDPRLQDYSTRLALALLKKHEARAYGELGPNGERVPMTADQLRASILRKLEEASRPRHGQGEGETDGE